MKESVEDLMKRIVVETDFEGKKYSNFIGVAPEVRLTYLYGVWVAELYCEAQICYFEGDKIEEIFPIICKETNWDGDSCFSGTTAIEALQQVGFNRIGIAKTYIHVDDSPQHKPYVIWTY